MDTDRVGLAYGRALATSIDDVIELSQLYDLVIVPFGRGWVSSFALNC